MKVVEISPQNARNCIIFKKNSWGGACPQTPLAKARSFAARDMALRGMYIQNPRNFKVACLRNPAYAPGDSNDHADMLRQMRLLYCRSNRLIRMFNKWSQNVELCETFCTELYCP